MTSSPAVAPPYCVFFPFLLFPVFDDGTRLFHCGKHQGDCRPSPFLAKMKRVGNNWKEEEEVEMGQVMDSCETSFIPPVGRDRRRRRRR